MVCGVIGKDVEGDLKREKSSERYESREVFLVEDYYLE